METNSHGRDAAAAWGSFNSATTFRLWKLGVAKVGGCYCAGFNSATTFRLWKPSWTDPRHCQALRFNSATTFRLWKPDAYSFGWKTISASFNSATTFRLWKPQQEAGRVYENIGFNSATTFRLWKPDANGVKGNADPSASILPQPFGYGNDMSFLDVLDCFRRLQFCHNLSVMETWWWWRYVTSWIRLQFCHNLSVMET